MFALFTLVLEFWQLCAFSYQRRVPYPRASLLKRLFPWALLDLGPAAYFLQVAALIAFMVRTTGRGRGVGGGVGGVVRVDGGVVVVGGVARMFGKGWGDLGPGRWRGGGVRRWRWARLVIR